MENVNNVGFTVSPFNSCYRKWSKFVGFVSLYISFVSIFELTFLRHQVLALSIINYMVTGSFFLDMVASFHLRYLDKKSHRFIRSLDETSNHYLKSWFVPDLISLLPPHLYHLMPAYLKPICGLFWIPRMIKLIRLITKTEEEDINLSQFLMHCLKLSILTLYSLHLSACIMYAVADLYPFSQNTWIGKSNEGKFKSEGVRSLYITSFYWSVTTFGTVGFGDFHPENELEMCVGSIIMCYFYLFGGYILASWTELFLRGRERSRRMRLAYELTEGTRLSGELRKQMCSLLSSNLERDEQHEALKTLSKSNLLSIVHHQIVQSKAFDGYFFRNVSYDLTFQLLTKMNIWKFGPNEDVILQGCPPEEMFIVIEGELDLVISQNSSALHRNGRLVGEPLRCGNVFGEIGIVLNHPQHFTVRTRGVCRLLGLQMGSFRRIFPPKSGDTAIIINNIIQHWRVSELPAMRNFISELQRAMTLGSANMPLCLSVAVLGNDQPLLRGMLKRKLKVNRCDNEGRTALHIAARRGANDCVRTLLEHGADPNFRDSEGIVPIWEAIKEEHETVYRLLIEHGADINRGDVAEYACEAVEKGKLHWLKKIVRATGDITRPRSDGRTALSLARETKKSPVIRYLEAVLDKWK